MAPIRRTIGRTATPVIALGLVLASIGGSASATTSSVAKPSRAAQQYQKIVAPFDRVLTQPKAPSIPQIRRTFAGTEKQLGAVHWAGQANGDMKVLVGDLRRIEPFFELIAKHPSVKQTKAQQAATVKFFADITKVRRDLGLAANENGL